MSVEQFSRPDPEDVASDYSVSGGPGAQPYVSVEGYAVNDKPVGGYPEDQFVIMECPGGYEGRSLPLPGSDTELDQQVLAAQDGATKALGGIIDVKTALRDVASRQGDN